MDGVLAYIIPKFNHLFFKELFFFTVYFSQFAMQNKNFIQNATDYC